MAELVCVPYSQARDRGFAVWADEYVRNESKRDSTAGELRRVIAQRLRALRPAGAEVLRASYAGSRGRGTDVENLLFNNIDQTLGLFAVSAGVGVRFHDLGTDAPVDPTGRIRSSYYNYELIDSGEPFDPIPGGKVLCSTPLVRVPAGELRIATRIWPALRTARPTATTELHDGPYALRITVTGINPGLSVKALVDGASTAMQRAIPTSVIVGCSRRLAHALGLPSQHVFELLTTAPAPLGLATRLLARDGEDAVRLTPDDDRCVAAQVCSTGDGSDPQGAVDLIG